MSNKKQTSVSWLVWELNKLGFFPNGVPQEIYKQAKELHKQEIIDAYAEGAENEFSMGGVSRSDYYNETYETDN
jgi:hypothetical protein